MKSLFVVLALTLSTIAMAQDEVYMANQAGGYLALTHDECKVPELRDVFPYHAYGVDGTGEIVGLACYQISPLPTRDEAGDVPKGMMLIPVVNLIDLQDGEIHTLEANWFSSDKPGKNTNA